MLAIARALMTNPALLLLDEPLEGLAPIVVEELAAAIRRMTSEGSNAFILVEQHADIALSLTRKRSLSSAAASSIAAGRRICSPTTPRSTGWSDCVWRKLSVNAWIARAFDKRLPLARSAS